MNEISLVFYGESTEVQNHLLFHLKLLKILPASKERAGFYSVESKFGREFLRKLSLDPLNPGSEAFLLFRYLSEKELQALEARVAEASPMVFYILSHKLFDRDYIKKTLLPRFPQAVFISDFLGTSLLHGVGLVKKEFKVGNILRLKTTDKRQGEGDSLRPMFQLPVLILFLLKIFINPISEIRRFSLLLKYSNLRIISRFLELFLALDFVLNAVVIKILRQLILRFWYSSNYLMGFFRVVLIKLGFGIRHIFLMSGFKSYGLLVDTYFSVLRWISGLLKFVLYGALYFLYYRVFLPGFSLIRHVLLIFFFRLYGLMFDFCTFSYRFTKLFLLYPVFKIYWFLAFQYKKRVKKLSL